MRQIHTQELDLQDAFEKWISSDEYKEQEAALFEKNELELLRSENARLREGLDRAATMLERVVKRGGFVVGCDAAAKEARAALGGE